MTPRCRRLTWQRLGGLLLAICALPLLGCARTVELPPVDLETPEWTVWTGQALWERPGGKTKLAGELLAARHTGGDLLVTFSKPPLSVFTARSAAGIWRIEFVERGRTRAGRGRPPKQFVGFVIPDVLAGQAPPAGWRVQRTDDGVVDLVHRDGERLYVVLDP